MPTKNIDVTIKPLSFLSLEELKCIQARLPSPLPPRFSNLFLVDTQQETYFLLDMAALSGEAAKKSKLLFEKITPHAASASCTVSEIKQAYNENNVELLDQLKINRVVAQALEIIGKDPSVESFSKMKDALRCCILQAPYIFPVLTPYGHTYERSGIVTHLEHVPQDPLAHQPCSTGQLIPNKAVSQLIELAYQYANADQLKIRIDSLMEKKKEIQEKEELIKKRDKLLILTSGAGPVIIHVGVTLLMVLIAVPLFTRLLAPPPGGRDIFTLMVLLSVPLFARLLALGRHDIFSSPPRTVEELEEKSNVLGNRAVMCLGFMFVFAWMTLTFLLSRTVNERLARREESLNKQIGLLDDLGNGSVGLSLQSQVKALDRQINALHELLEPQKPSPTTFFRNSHRHVESVSSEAQPSTDVKLAI